MRPDFQRYPLTRITPWLARAAGWPRVVYPGEPSLMDFDGVEHGFEVLRREVAERRRWPDAFLTSVAKAAR